VFEVGFQAHKKANPLQLYQVETLSFRTLDHRMAAARVCAPGVPKGKTKQEEGRRCCLMMMHGATNARREGKTHPHHETSHRRRHNNESDAINLYGWGWRCW